METLTAIGKRLLPLVCLLLPLASSQTLFAETNSLVRNNVKPGTDQAKLSPKEVLLMHPNLNIRVVVPSQEGFKLFLSYSLPGLPADSLKPEVFHLTNPPRVICDIPGIPTASLREVKVEHGILKNVRLEETRLRAGGDQTLAGTRIVFFLNGELQQKPVLNVDNKSGEIRLLVGALPDDSSNPQDGSDIARANPAKETSPDSSAAQTSLSHDFWKSEKIISRASLKTRQDPIAKSQNDLSGNEKDLHDIKAEDQVSKALEQARNERVRSYLGKTPKAIISGAQYRLNKKQNKDLPAIAIAVSQLRSYRLRRASDELFKVELYDCEIIDERLKLPQFAPEEYSGLEVFQLNKVADKVLVDVYVEPGTELTPFRTTNTLWLRVDR